MPDDSFKRYQSQPPEVLSDFQAHHIFGIRTFHNTDFVEELYCETFTFYNFSPQAVKHVLCLSWFFQL